MKKLFLLAMLTIFQLPALMAQDEPILVNVKTNEDGIRIEEYEPGGFKYVFENGDFFWDDNSERLPDEPSMNGSRSFRMTYNNAIAEKKEDNGKCYITFNNGTIVTTQTACPRVVFNTKSCSLEEIKKRDMVVLYDKNGPAIPKNVHSTSKVFGVKVMVEPGKYEEYVDFDGWRLSRVNNTSDYLYFYNFNFKNATIETTSQIVVTAKHEKTEVSKERMTNSIEERNRLYNVDLRKELITYDEEIQPQGLQKEWIIQMVESGHGDAVGLPGMQYKDLKKLVKKNQIDLDAVVQRYEHTLDSIVKSWTVVLGEETEAYIYPVGRNDTIIDVALSEGTNKYGKERILHTLKYKNGDEITICNHRDDRSNIDFGKTIFKHDGSVEDYIISDLDIISGTKTKDNGVLTIKPDGSITIALNNGTKFRAKDMFGLIIEGGGMGSANEKALLTAPQILPYTGVLVKEDGTGERVEEGYTESQRLAMKKAEEERIAKAEAEVYEAIEGKYGKIMAEAFKNGDFVKGMPEELFKLMCQLHGITLKPAIRRSSGSICYDLYVGIYSLMGQDPDVGFVWFNNGKLSSWTLYR